MQEAQSSFANKANEFYVKTTEFEDLQILQKLNAERLQ